MGKKVIILVSSVLFITVIIGLIHFQAKRIVMELIEANASDRIEAKIGRLKVNVFNSSLTLQDLMVNVREKNSDNFKKTTVKNAFLDVASLWDFYFGGTLVIEKLQLEGGELVIYNRPRIDTARHNTFDLSAIIQRIKTDAIRFQIQDIAFTDFNLILFKDSVQAPTSIKHLRVRARDVYLSADSVLKRKPLIEFSLPRQTIVTDKGLSIAFDSLFFTTRDNSIQMNRLELNSPVQSKRNAYRVNAEKVRIAHFDFESLYTHGVVAIDSVFLGRSALTLKWLVESSGKKKKKSSEIPALPEITIRHLNVSDLASDIRIRKDSIENSFNIDNAFVTAEDLRHRPDSSQKFTVHDFTIFLAKYSTFLSNKNTAIDFDTVQLQKHRLSLLNFKLRTADQEQPLLQTSTFELDQIDWVALLIDKRLVARQALVLNPIVYTSIKSKENQAPGKNLVVLNSLREFLEVKLFSLKNSTAFVNLIDSRTNITLKGMDAAVWIDEMMDSKDINQGLTSVKEFSFRNLTISHPEFNGHIENFHFGNGHPSIGQLTVESEGKINLSAGDLALGKLDWDASQRFLSVGGLGWKTMQVDINNTGKQPTPKENVSGIPGLRIDQIRGGDTRLAMSTPDLTMSARISKFNLSELQWLDSILVRGMDIKGNDFSFQAEPIRSDIGAFSFTDQGGTLDHLRFSRMSVDSLESHISHMTFQAPMMALLKNEILVDELLAEGMETRYTKRDSVRQLKIILRNNLALADVSYREKKFSIGSLSVEGGPIDFFYTNKVRKAEDHAVLVTKRKLREIRTDIDSLLHTNNSIRMLELTQKDNREDDLTGIDSSLFVNHTTNISSEEGGVKLFLSAVEVFSQDSVTQLKAKLNSLALHQVSVKTNNLTAQIQNGSVYDIKVNSNQLKELKNGIEENYATAGIRNLKSTIEVKGNRIQFDRFDFDPAKSMGSIKGFDLRPLKSKQEFLDDSYYQTNYMHTRIDSISFGHFNIKRFLDDSVLHLKSIYVASPSLEIHRDKTHPFFSAAIKLLPTNAFRKVPLKFKLDTLQFGGGKISYTEKSRITGKEGTIYFTGLQGLVTNVKNVDLDQYDSLYMQARTRFLDSATVSMRMRESYQDSLAGFLLTTHVGPFHTSILNPALVPMVAVEFQSGQVDTLQMHAIGREYLSLGKMKFYYRDLKVNFLDRSDTSKHSLKQQFMKFAANTFVIRTNNSKRLGTVFYERDRNRAVFQYWVKMILSGATTSVGAKSNRKQIKRYLKDLNQKRVPSIKEDFNL